MSKPNGSPTDETVSVNAQLDQLCDRYEFLLLAGQQVTVADFLRSEGIDPADAAPDLLTELDRLAVYYHPDNRPTVTTASADDAGTMADIAPGAVLAGRYTLVEEIGGGGMGVVWKAKQTMPVKRFVAVKVIKQGMDTKAVLARFEAERQALAMMDHDNIARVFDAGMTPAGRPFFVMELVNGVPITKFCDARKLPPKTRLELFASVCEAIQHAHLKGVIHRDIKPGNVLVALSDGRPVVKVIDFGIVKATGAALTDRTLVTGLGTVIGTPEYMSPEQAGLNNLDIDTRSDVYSLGVLLYELLTGRTPVDRKSLEKAALHEILRIVREEDAPRPSHKLSTADGLPSIAANRATEPARLTRMFRGELDWVLLKSLEKDRSRRYQSANAFAADVRNYLADEVVEARPPSRGYRLRKFVRRHRGAVIAAAAVFVALMAGIAGTTLGLMEAKQGRDDAEEARGKETTQRGIAEVSAKDANAARIQAEAARTQADTARREAVAQLWRSQLSEARANTRSGVAGQRFGSLKLIQTALKTAEQTGLTDADRKQFRDVATSALALPDLEVAHSWPIPLAGLHHLAIDAGFERYARTTDSGAVSVRRVSDDAELYAFPPTGAARMVTLSDSGKVLVVSDSAGPVGRRIGRVYRLDGPKPVLLTDLPVLLGMNVFVTPDDQRVVFSTETTVGVWDARTKKKKSWPLPGPHHGFAALSRDGRRFAVGCVKGSQSLLHVRDVETGTVVADLPLLSTVDACAWHPNGRIVAVGTQRKIQLWDVDAKRVLRTLEGHTNGGIMPAFDPTGARLLSNDWSSILRVWDWQTGRQVLKISAGWNNYNRSVSADGRVLIGSADAQRMNILQFRPGVERQPFAVPHTPALYMHADPAGRFAVVTQNKGDFFGRPVVTDLARGEVLGQLPIHASGQRVFHIATDGALLSNGGSGLVRWPLTADPVAKTLRFGPPERIAGFTHGDHHSASANGQVIAVPNYSAGAVVFRADRAWAGLPLGPQHDVRNTAVSPCGRFVVTGSHGTSTQVGVKVWDAKTGTRVAELKDPNGSVIFSPDGRWLAKHWAGFRLWQTADWKPGPLVSQPESIHNCVFSPDSRVLAVAGHKVVRLIRVADGTELVRLPYAEESTVMLKCFGPGGGTLYACGNDTGELVAWDLRRLRAGLAELGLDWDEPPLAPPAPPAPAWKVEFVGFEILSDPQAMARQRGEMIATAVRENPNEVQVHQIDFGYAVTNGLWLRAATAHDRAVKLRPNDAGLRLGFAGLYAERGRTAAAATDMSEALKIRPHPDSMIWYEHALLLIASGHTDEYRKVCAAMVARYGTMTDAGLGNLAHTVALHPRGLDDSAEIVRFAKKRMFVPGLSQPWSDYVLAKAYYRAGRYGSALAAIPPSPTAIEPQDGFLRAMAYHRMGDAATAQAAWAKASAELARLRSITPNLATYPPAGWNWRDWLLVHLLRDEAQAVLREPPEPPHALAPPPRELPPRGVVIGFRELHGADMPALKAWLATLPENLRPTHLTPRIGSDGKLFDAIALDDGTDAPFEAHLALGPKEKVKYGQDSDDPAMWARGWSRSWCVFDSSGGTFYRHHFWSKGQTFDSVWPPEGKLADGLATLRSKRLRPVGLIAYGGSLFLHGGPDEGLAWEFHVNLTPAQVQEKLGDARKRRWRPTVVHRHDTDANKFAVVLVANPQGVPWEYRLPMTVLEYEAALADLGRKGLHPQYVQSWMDKNQPVYSAVWVGGYQPGERVAPGESLQDDAISAAVRAHLEAVKSHWRDFSDAAARGLWPQAAAAHDRAVKLRPGDARLRLDYAVRYADAGRWTEAAADFASALEIRPHDDPYAWFEQALLFVVTKDANGYRRLCERMLTHYGKDVAGNPLAAVAHACALAPDALGDPARVVRLAQARLKTPGLPADHLPWSKHLLALAYYRAGRAADALEAIRPADPKPATGLEPYDGFVRAMAYQRLGQAELAKAAWEKSSAEVDRLARSIRADASRAAPMGWTWRNWRLALLLRDEAQGVLREPPGKPRELAPPPRPTK